INWGDGTTSAGTIAGSNGSFSVSGAHTYADEGSEALSVSIRRSSDGASIAPTGTVTVNEGDVLTPHGTSISATASQAFSGVVATFSDTGFPNNVPSDFSASIDWGDGTSSAGTIAGGSGTFSVSGTHTYAAAGTDTLHVT